MKKVVLILPDAYEYGGMARVTITLANELVLMEDYHITILSLSSGSGKKTFYEISKDIDFLQLPIKNFKLRRHMPKVIELLRNMFPANFEGTFVVDDVGYSILAWLGLKQNKNARFICWSHMNFFNGSRWGFSGWGKRLAVKKFDYLVALTKEDQEYYNQVLKAKNIVQIYNPVDANIIKQKYAVDSKKIISCGRLHPFKGFDILIDVAKEIFREIDDWSWDIYGDGPEQESLQRKIDHYGLQGKVNLMGYRSDILSLYKNYAFYVFTSRSEGCPMTMIEALSAGLPMISFDFKCGPKDLITNGENGFIISNWNLDDMKDKILQLINDKELRIKFAENSGMNLQELELTYVLEQWKKIL